MMKGIKRRVMGMGLAVCIGAMMLSPVASAHGHGGRHHSSSYSCNRNSCSNSRHNHRGCTRDYCTIEDCTGRHYRR